MLRVTLPRYIYSIRKQEPRNPPQPQYIWIKKPTLPYEIIVTDGSRHAKSYPQHLSGAQEAPTPRLQVQRAPRRSRQGRHQLPTQLPPSVALLIDHLTLHHQPLRPRPGTPPSQPITPRSCPLFELPPCARRPEKHRHSAPPDPRALRKG